MPRIKLRLVAYKATKATVLFAVQSLQHHMPRIFKKKHCSQKAKENNMRDEIQNTKRLFQLITKQIIK